MASPGRSVEGASGEEGASSVGNGFQQATHELLRLQEQRTATAMRQMEQKLQEKDSAVRALQERLQEFEERLTALEVSGKEEALQLLEGRVQKVEASLQRAIDKFFPRVEALLRQFESSPREEPRASISSAREETTPGGAAASALEEERERQRMQFRVREVEKRKDRARVSPCPLGEDLCKAASENNLSVVRRLLDSGAKVNYTGRDGLTPLLRACWHKAKEAASLLVERGADVSAISSSGNSALHLASSAQSVLLLLGAGADVDARNLEGATPLHHAVRDNNVTVVRALVLAGARRHLKGWRGYYKDKAPSDVAHSAAAVTLLQSPSIFF